LDALNHVKRIMGVFGEADLASTVRRIAPIDDSNPTRPTLTMPQPISSYGPQSSRALSVERPITKRNPTSAGALLMLDEDMYPTVAKFLQMLPGGLSAYPHAMTTADYSLYLREAHPAVFSSENLSATHRQVFNSRWRPNDWIYETVANAMVLMVYDQQFANQESFADWTFEFCKTFYKRPLTKALMRIATPHLVFMGAAKRWSSFHKGSTLSSRGTKYNGHLKLDYPPHLFHQVNLVSMGAAYRAAIASAGGKQVSIKVQPGVKEAIFDLSWQ
jgi:hypothetical protein